MSLITWDDKLILGIDSVDKQHKRLIDLINRLDEAVAVGLDPNTLVETVDALLDYTVYHFSYEEQLMQRAGYASNLLRQHRDEHKEFIEKMRSARNEAIDDPSKLPEELLDYLVNWISHHILKTDKHMASSLLQGVDGTAVKLDSDELAVIMQSHLYSALRESEGRFRELSDYLPALIWITNSKNIPIFCNDFWFKTFGIKPGLYDKTLLWYKSVHPEDLERLTDAYARAAAELTKVKLQYRLLKKDGSIMWIMETAAPRIRKDGTFAGLMGCGMDITSQKKAEKTLAHDYQLLEQEVTKRTRQLQEANEKLEWEKNQQILLNNQLKEAQGHLIQSEKMASIGQLAAGVAHEINNPLGYIYSNLNSLKQYIKDLLQFIEQSENLVLQLPPENAEVFSRLRQTLDIDFLTRDLEDLVNESLEGATRAQKIVKDLRDFSRVDRQERELFDLEAGLDATLNIVNNEIKYKAEVVKEYAGIKPFVCVGAQLNQVFMNLLVNAAHAIEKFGKITVRTGYKDEHWLWVEVEDNGCGISDEIRSKIFDPFFTTKPVGKGTGLGLSLSYKIIKDHHGIIDIQSVVGQGTKFRIYLPIKGDDLNT
ncbi:MAG: bacteriohemerythrin [Gammaproteobacteria bacterium]